MSPHRKNKVKDYLDREISANFDQNQDMQHKFMDHKHWAMRTHNYGSWGYLTRFVYQPFAYEISSVSSLFDVHPYSVEEQFNMDHMQEIQKFLDKLPDNKLSSS